MPRSISTRDTRREGGVPSPSPPFLRGEGAHHRLRDTKARLLLALPVLYREKLRCGTLSDSESIVRGESPHPDSSVRIKSALPPQAGRGEDLSPPRRSPIHFRFALCFLGEFGRDRCGLRRRAPARRVAAVAPGLRPVEGVDAELVHLLHFADPGRTHPIRMIVRRLADLGRPYQPV